MHYRIMSGHGLRDPPNGCKIGIFEWKIGGEDFYGSTRRFRTRKERKSCVQTQESFVWAHAIAEGVVPTYQLVLH